MGQMSLSIWLLTSPLLPELLQHHFLHLNHHSCHHPYRLLYFIIIITTIVMLLACWRMMTMKMMIMMTMLMIMKMTMLIRFLSINHHGLVCRKQWSSVQLREDIPPTDVKITINIRHQYIYQIQS